MRIRIALTTAVAVMLIPIGLLLAMFNGGGSSAVAATKTRHEAATRTVKRLKAEKAAHLAAFYQAVYNSQLANFYQAINNQQEAAWYTAVNNSNEAAWYTAVNSSNEAAWYEAVNKNNEAAWYEAVLASERAPAPADPAPAAQTASAPAPATGGGNWSGPWACIAQNESGGNPSEDTGNGFYGGLQFTEQTWQAYGGTGNPADASIAQQEAVAQNVLAAQGWGAWPNTSRECGL